ncbi:hypothetical protein [Escherichia coli]|uniref:hypothetical protein n=1 Tax=Escherichia coli TaxID=562 RepID=UPI00389057C5
MMAFDELRFSGVLTPKRAKAGRRVTQLHYASPVASSRRKWNSRHPREYGRERIRSEVYATSIRE